MDPVKRFKYEVDERISDLAKDEKLKSISLNWLKESMEKKYVYNFSWLGRPIIQYPQDIIAIQEILWNVKPDVVIETGIAHGGSLILSASILSLINKGGIVIGIDVDIREHNRIEIENHPLFEKITLIEGSSISLLVINKISELIKDKNKILVILDSNHTHDHVLNELNLYAPFVSIGSYLIVFDTFIEDMPKDFFEDRPWNKGNNSKTAVNEFLLNNDEFKVDHTIESKLLITAAPGGYLKKISK